MGDIENFADAPRTIGEIRSEKTQSALDWKPRDALIYLLREIDSGRMNVDHVVVCWRERLPEGQYDPKTEGSYRTNYKQAGGSNYAWDGLALLARAMQLIGHAN